MTHRSGPGPERPGAESPGVTVVDAALLARAGRAAVLAHAAEAVGAHQRAELGLVSSQDEAVPTGFDVAVAAVGRPLQGGIAVAADGVAIDTLMPIEPAVAVGVLTQQRRIVVATNVFCGRVIGRAARSVGDVAFDVGFIVWSSRSGDAATLKLKRMLAAAVPWQVVGMLRRSLVSRALTSR